MSRRSLPTGVTLRVLESGSSSGDPIVMLHGWGACVYTFRHGFAALAERGHRVIGVDARGYGLSDRPLAAGSFTLDAYLSDLDALLDDVGAPRAWLVGHSMGGGIALHYALRSPARVRGIALINPVGLVPIPIIAMTRFSPRRIVERLIECRVPRWLVAIILRHVAFHASSRVAARDIDEYWAPTKIYGYVHAVRGAIAEFDWQPLAVASAARLAVPTVVILGNQDRLIRGAREPAAGLRGAAVHCLEGGHCVHEEHPDVVYPTIAEFFAHAGNKYQNELN